MLNKKFVFAVSLVAMMAVSNAWATDPASTSSTTDTVGTAHSVFTEYTPTEAGSKAGIAGVTYVNRAVNSAGNAAIAAENHAAASGAYAIDAKTAAQQANTAAAAAKAAADAAQATASDGVTKANAAQQTADENTAAISGMDLDSVGADGSYIKTVAQADGKVTATAEAADTTPTQNSKKMVTSGGVYTALSNKLDKTGTALKATADASGNVITSTYATKSELTSGLATKQGTLKAGTNITISDDNTISSTYTYTLPTATDDVKGGMKLYTASGSATDGTMTQRAITDLVDLETGNVLEEAQGIVDNLETRVNANTTNISNLQTTVAGKQGTLSEAQLAAVNSGITKTKVGTYDGYSALITNAQNTANSKLATATYNTQVGTVNSANMGTEATTVVGAIKEVATEAADAQTAADAAQQTADTANATANENKTDIASIKTEQATQNTNISNLQTAVAGKQATLSEAQLAAVNSGITKTKVGTYDGYSALITNAQNTANSKLATATYNTQVGTVSATNMGTEATTVVGGIKEAVTEAAAAQSTADKNTAAISGMDLTSVGADGSYIKTVAQADGKVTATAEAADTTPTQNSKKMVTSGGVYTALSNKLDKTGTAPKATADASGNVITTTYATKSELTSGLATKQGTLKAGTNITISDDNTISSTYTYTLPTATDDVKGGMKLYTASGAATDGTMTQKAITALVDSETNDVLEEAQGIVDDLETRVSANETNISNLQTTVAGKQATLAAKGSASKPVYVSSPGTVSVVTSIDRGLLPAGTTAAAGIVKYGMIPTSSSGTGEALIWVE